MTSFAVFWILFKSILLFFGAHAKPNERTFWFVKRTRAGETCQGRLRQFDEAIPRFVDGNFKLLDLYSALDESHSGSE